MRYFRLTATHWKASAVVVSVALVLGWYIGLAYVPGAYCLLGVFFRSHSIPSEYRRAVLLRRAAAHDPLAIVAALNSPDLMDGVPSVIDAARIVGRPAIDAVLEVTRARDPEARAAAVHVLGALDPVWRATYLPACLSDPDSRVRRAAVQRMCINWRHAFEKPLLDSLEDQDEQVRLEIITRILYLHPCDRLLARLRKSTEKDPSLRVRQAASEKVLSMSNLNWSAVIGAHDF